MTIYLNWYKYFNMVKEVLPLIAEVFGTFQRKNDDILELKLIILLEMVEKWICITLSAKLLILLVL